MNEKRRRKSWRLGFVVKPTKICIGTLFWCITLHDANENMLHCCQVRRFYEFYMYFSTSFLTSFTRFASFFLLFVIYSRFFVQMGFLRFLSFRSFACCVLFCLFWFFRIFWLYRLFCVFCLFFPKCNRIQKKLSFFNCRRSVFQLQSFVQFHCLVRLFYLIRLSHLTIYSIFARFFLILIAPRLVYHWHQNSRLHHLRFHLRLHSSMPPDQLL